MMSSLYRYLGLLVTTTAPIGAVEAAPVLLSPVSYSMPNGDGQASGGSYNYWDLSYSGAGAKTTDGAPLTGGKGDLTNGVTASDFWYNVENAAGTGPYVGWYFPVTPNPIITFNFTGGPTINQINLQFDNSYVGGVYQPSAIKVDGTSVAFTPLAQGTIGTISLMGLNLTGNVHTIELDQAFNAWVFSSEITFLGSASSAVPEPASWALMLTGFGVVGFGMRRRHRIAARMSVKV